jgi:hypothetical protein
MPTLSSPVPTPRASSTATVVPGDRIIVFGGFDGTSRSRGATSDGRDFLDDLWVLHTLDDRGQEKFAWEEISKPPETKKRESDWPMRRSGHSACAWGSTVFVFGGRSSHGRFNDLHCLNTDSMTWTLADTFGDSPCARKTHAMARVKDRLFVLGGHNGSPNGWLDDMYILFAAAAFRAANPSRVAVDGASDADADADSSAGVMDSAAPLRSDLASLLDIDLEADLLNPPLPVGEGSAPVPPLGSEWLSRESMPPPSSSMQRFFPSDWGSRATLGDVTFVVQGRKITLHRSILAARSEYFRAMFTSTLVEATLPHPVIPLEDVPLPTFLALVRYLYLDLLPPRPVRDRLVPGLLEQAQKLGIARLSLLCQHHLASRLNVHNAVTMLDAADTFGALPLRRAAFAFVLAHFTAVSKTLPFLQLRADLLRHIMWRRARRKSSANDRQALTWTAVEQGLDGRDWDEELPAAQSAESAPRQADESVASGSLAASPATLRLSTILGGGVAPVAGVEIAFAAALAAPASRTGPEKRPRESASSEQEPKRIALAREEGIQQPELASDDELSDSPSSADQADSARSGSRQSAGARGNDDSDDSGENMVGGDWHATEGAVSRQQGT